MALIRWEPVRELNTIQSEMNRLFNTFFEGGPANGGTTQRRWLPAMDLVESQDDFVLRADLPGLGEDDVNIELEDNVLTISGQRKSEHEAESRTNTDHDQPFRFGRCHGQRGRVQLLQALALSPALHLLCERRSRHLGVEIGKLLPRACLLLQQIGVLLIA